MTATMIEREAMIRAVCAAPEDDNVPLIFADWCDENGEPERGEFIRVQCELAKMDAAGVGRGKSLFRQRADALRRRECRLLPVRWNEWAKPLPVTYLIDRATDTRGAFGVKYTRGFVSEVRASLAVLFGGECGRCGGHRLINTGGGGPHHPWTPCPRCHGEGRTVGIAARLFREQPVTRVVCVGAEPEQNAYSGVDCSWQSFSPHRDSWLPFSLLKCLPGYEWDGQEWMRYPTRQVALDALSTAVVRLGRELAGVAAVDATYEDAR